MPGPKRAYEESHPWLTFELDAREFSHDLWMLLGEARSKCEHLAGVPLRPETARKLHGVYLAKGIAATTAIEGNTLSEEQVAELLAGELKLPPSQDYLRKEVENIVGALGEIFRRLEAGESISVQMILDFNRRVLDGAPDEADARPGEIRTHSVTVGRYRGAPAADCEYLLGRLSEWLNGSDFAPAGALGIVVGAMLAAVVGHLYIAWIHPFGDGNGRTARLVEFALLVRAGVPTPAAHLLSNHYNKTRAEYYRQLDAASRSGGKVAPFVHYAVQGFVDGLREQVTMVRNQQLDVAWRNHVHELFRDGKGPSKRRRDLVLALSRAKDPISLAEIMALAPVTKAYAGRSPKTLQRDLLAARAQGLVVDMPGGRWRARTELIQAFLPAHRLPGIPTATGIAAPPQPK